jgi:hypothetical protein
LSSSPRGRDWQSIRTGGALVGGVTARGLAPIPITPEGVFSHPPRLTLHAEARRLAATRPAAWLPALALAHVTCGALVGGATARGLTPIPITPEGVFSHPSRLALQAEARRLAATRPEARRQASALAPVSHGTLVGGATARGLALLSITPECVFSHPPPPASHRRRRRGRSTATRPEARRPASALARVTSGALVGGATARGLAPILPVQRRVQPTHPPHIAGGGVAARGDAPCGTVVSVGDSLCHSWRLGWRR